MTNAKNWIVVPYASLNVLIKNQMEQVILLMTYAKYALRDVQVSSTLELQSFPKYLRQIQIFYPPSPISMLGMLGLS